MNQEVFQLKWKFFQKYVSLALDKETTESQFADVTLFSDELIPFKAHKFVLSANSPLMKEMLLNNPHPEPSIYLNGVQAQELESMLHMMYYGEATYHINRLESLITAMNKFHLTNSQEGQTKMETGQRRRKARPSNMTLHGK